MLRVFLTEYRTTSADIDTALDSSDPAHATTLLHRLRGAAGALGAVETATSAGVLEDALSQYNGVNAAQRAEFVAVAVRTMATLETLPTQPDPGASDQHTTEAPPTLQPTATAAETTQHLNTLEALLVAGNTRALDYLPWLHGYIDTELADDYRTLAQQIEALEFTQALQTLQQLARP